MRTLDDLPGPRRIPVLGNPAAFRSTTLLRVVEDWSVRHGPVYRLDLGPRRVIAIADERLIGLALRDRPGRYRRWSEIEQTARETSSAGVFAAEGEDWHRQRRLAVTALNSDHLARYFEAIETACGRLHARVAAGAAPDGGAVDLAREFSTYAVGVTSRLAFGQDLEELEAGEAIEEDLVRVFHAMGRRLSAAVPYWRVVRLPADRAVDRAVAALQHTVAGFVARARERVAAQPELLEHPENFLDGMLAAQARDGAITDDELFGNVLTMLLAGEDTTSHTLAWASWYLATHPRAQAALTAEADAALGERRWPVDHAAADHLPYAEAVVRETLRLKSAAPLIFLEATQDSELGDLRFPKGTRLMLLTRMPALREENFAGAASFRPERWLPGFAGTHRPKALLSFGAGPRFCPGRNLAFLEAKAALAVLGRSFALTLDPAAPPVQETFGFTMAPVGLRVLVRERPAAAPAPAVPGALA